MSWHAKRFAPSCRASSEWASFSAPAGSWPLPGGTSRCKRERARKGERAHLGTQAGATVIPGSANPPRDAPHGVPKESLGAEVMGRVRDYFLGDDPNFWVAMVPSLLVSALLFTRSLTTNFIF